MNPASGPQSTNTRIVSHCRAYVVYDTATGEVLHVHHSVTFPHGAPMREKPEARALRLAGNKAGASAQVLEVEGAEVNHRDPIRIDTAKRVVVRGSRP
jgi:hypothetical protein